MTQVSPKKYLRRTTWASQREGRLFIQPRHRLCRKNRARFHQPIAWHQDNLWHAGTSQSSFWSHEQHEEHKDQYTSKNHSDRTLPSGFRFRRTDATLRFPRPATVNRERVIFLDDHAPVRVPCMSFATHDSRPLQRSLGGKHDHSWLVLNYDSVECFGYVRKYLAHFTRPPSSLVWCPSARSSVARRGT